MYCLLHCLLFLLKHTLPQTLAEAIEVAGLSEALSGGSFTIFAPTDNVRATLSNCKRRSPSVLIVFYFMFNFVVFVL
jgi:hypothetical protein